MTCWAEDNSRSLAEVADAAGVGRTTVNRYFASRSDLVDAVDLECRDRFAAAVARARPAEGPGLVALQRICVEITQLGPVLGLIFADNAVVDPDTWGDDANSLGATVVRGQSDGSIAADLPAGWVATHTWTTLFAAHLMIQTSELTGHEVAQLLTRTLATGIAG